MVDKTHLAGDKRIEDTLANGVPEVVVKDELGIPSYGAAALPAGVGDGTQVFDTNRDAVAWWGGAHWDHPSVVRNADVLVEPVTVANTTTRTTVFDPGIDADALVPGRTYQMDLMGKFSTANTSAEFSIDITVGSVTDAGGLGSVGKVVTDAPWSVEFTLTVRDDGTTGTVATHARGLFDTAANGSHHDPITVDTTGSIQFFAGIKWDEADPDNSVTLGQAHLKKMA